MDIQYSSSVFSGLKQKTKLKTIPHSHSLVRHLICFIWKTVDILILYGNFLTAADLGEQEKEKKTYCF